MTRRRNQLAEVQQTCRDLRNKLNEVEFPLQKRIRELELERDKFSHLAREGADRIERLERGLAASQAYILWLLSTGKSG